MKEDNTTIVYMLILLGCIVFSAFQEYPYVLAAASALLIIKQLGRINNTLKGSGDER